MTAVSLYLLVFAITIPFITSAVGEVINGAFSIMMLSPALISGQFLWAFSFKNSSFFKEFSKLDALFIQWLNKQKIFKTYHECNNLDAKYLFFGVLCFTRLISWFSVVLEDAILVADEKLWFLKQKLCVGFRLSILKLRLTIVPIFILSFKFWDFKPPENFDFINKRLINGFMFLVRCKDCE